MVGVERGSGRRAANKEHTRQAILAAARQLVEQGRTTALTAESIADLAGVSRRTLFNYFPGVDDVIVEVALEAANRTFETISERVEQGPLLTSAVAIMDEVLTTELLGELVPIWQAVELSPAAAGRMLQLIQLRTDALSAQLCARTGSTGDDALLLAVTVSVMFAAFETARRRWLEGLRLPVDDADRSRLVDLVTHALTMARRGLDYI